MTSLSVSHRSGYGWRLEGTAACAYNPDYTADTDDEFVDLARGPGGGPNFG